MPVFYCLLLPVCLSYSLFFIFLFSLFSLLLSLPPCLPASIPLSPLASALLCALSLPPCTLPALNTLFCPSFAPCSPLCLYALLPRPALCTLSPPVTQPVPHSRGASSCFFPASSARAFLFKIFSLWRALSFRLLPARSFCLPG
ncbi:uncharacterized protein NEPG_02657 [Nematocida parisii ERTm1]|uniref:uncharacterized protein n=1 Tax=Nematocida parisii (strain ERTm1 / ATCC PRA-289) TaxID=881290 RepID=UPI000264BA22|nr:uncharacterized protein NEPG_02657 [Nematocida parisii ERTm1]EIJ92480.1 hypothetical protein NEPG_02657 [Nematocida parisii ERTm1]|eukprot:XP_013060484.1 hypothetical protein NEPG_02657 [Nematocida parisii ERTm1]